MSLRSCGLLPVPAAVRKITYYGEWIANRAGAGSSAAQLAHLPAPHVVEDRGRAPAVPIALQKLDALARGPPRAARVCGGEAGAVDGVITAAGRLVHLHHVPLRRQVEVTVLPMATMVH